MAVTDWIDKIARNFEISDGRGGTVVSYRAYDKANFPDALNDFPCAITYITEMRSQYSLGGPCIDLYNGVTEFHLTGDVSKAKLPYIMAFFARIRDAAAGDITLDATVDHWLLRQDLPSIQGPAVLQFGDEAPHYGLIVNWEVKENVTGDFTPAA